MLPIVQRELLVASRSKSTHRERVWFCLGILMAGGWLFYMMSQNQSPVYVGRTLFMILTGYLFILAGSTGIRETSDSLSGEKPQGGG